MDATIIIGILSPIVTMSICVLTYYGNNIARAKKDGQMVHKLEQCIKDIENIRLTIKEEIGEVRIELKETRVEARDDRTRTWNAIDTNSKDIAILKTQVNDILGRLEK